jgi:hypothetical protein
MLEEDEEDVNLDELRDHLDELAANEANGREIRNTDYSSIARRLPIRALGMVASGASN